MNLHSARSLLRKFVETCNREGLDIILSHGTALGAYRERDIIKHDNDIDVEFIYTSTAMEKAHKVIASLYGLKVQPISRPFNFVRAWKIFQGDAKLDFSATFTFKKKTWTPCSTKNSSNVLSLHFLRNAVSKHFLGVEVLVPEPIEDYLETVYGKTYMIPREKYKHFHIRHKYRETNSLGGYDIDLFNREKIKHWYPYANFPLGGPYHDR